MALTRDDVPTYHVGPHEGYPVEGGVRIFQGAAVGITAAGFARPLLGGDAFVGFVDDGDGVDNTGPPVYASDDNTFTLTSTGNSLVGRVSRFNQGPQCVIAFQAAHLRN